MINFKRRWTRVCLESKNLTVILLIILTVLIVQIALHVILGNPTIYCKPPRRPESSRLRLNADDGDGEENLPIIYTITPTYNRAVQKAELTRLSHTFMLIPNLHWIIIEDSWKPSDLVEKFIRRLKEKFNFNSITSLHEPTPEAFKVKPNEPGWRHPRGVWQRNKALDWIRNKSNVPHEHGIVYFADDDNTYDLELFSEMRDIRRVGVWPVGLVGGLLVERPIVKDGKVKDFNARWASDRAFPIDMAGFAISLRLIRQQRDSVFSAQQKIGHLESHFLGLLVKSWDELEPKAGNCTEVLVWHTRTRNPNLSLEKGL